MAQGRGERGPGVRLGGTGATGSTPQAPGTMGGPAHGAELQGLRVAVAGHTPEPSHRPACRVVERGRSGRATLPRVRAGARDPHRVRPRRVNGALTPPTRRGSIPVYTGQGRAFGAPQPRPPRSTTRRAATHAAARFFVGSQSPSADGTHLHAIEGVDPPASDAPPIPLCDLARGTPVSISRKAALWYAAALVGVGLQALALLVDGWAAPRSLPRIAVLVAGVSLMFWCFWRATAARAPVGVERR